MCVLGSCVTRDIWRVMKRGPGASLAYFARTSVATLTSPPVRMVEDEAVQLWSPFQRRSVLGDASREPLLWIERNRPEVLFLDFADDRFDLIDTGEGLLLDSTELQGAKIVPTRFKGARCIERLSDECEQIWFDGFDACLARIHAASPGTRIVLHRAWFQETIAHPDRTERWPQEIKVTPTRKVPIAELNRVMRSYYEHVQKRLPGVDILEPGPEHQVSAHQHQWGPHPLHYVDSYYGACWDQMASMLGDAVFERARIVDVRNS
jgi:hypothetical protein